MVEQHRAYTIELVSTQYETDIRGKVKKCVAYVRKESTTSDYIEVVVDGKTQAQALKRACKQIKKWQKNEV